MCKHVRSMYVPKIEMDKGGRKWMFLISIRTLVWVSIQSSINPMCFCPLCGIHEWTFTLILHLKYVWVQEWGYRRQLTSVNILLTCSVSPDLCFLKTRSWDWLQWDSQKENPRPPSISRNLARCRDAQPCCLQEHKGIPDWSQCLFIY